MTMVEKKNHINKTIRFVYSHIMDFRRTDNVKSAIFSANLLDNVNCLIYSENVIHHSHITVDIIGDSHSFCNLKVRENKNQISVTAHNLFGFDFFFLFKKHQASFLENYTNISIVGTNLVNINFANIANQVKFINTLKYYQNKVYLFWQQQGQTKETKA